MKNKQKALHGLLGLLLSLSFLGTSAWAEPVLDDFQAWQIGVLRGHITDRVLWYLDTQNNEVNLPGQPGRSAHNPDNNHFTHEGQLLVRPALGYQLNKAVSVWQGYGWTPSYQPQFRNEHQIWEQVLLQKNFKHLNLSNRTRLEIRRIQDAQGTALRLRDQLRAAIPLGKTPWSLVAYDEPFFNLNSVQAGPHSGFNQNWAFLGINRKITRNVNAEVGYLNNYVRNFRPVPDRINHVIMFSLNINLDWKTLHQNLK
jgi:hypothetical protein